MKCHLKLHIDITLQLVLLNANADAGFAYLLTVQVRVRGLGWGLVARRWMSVTLGGCVCSVGLPVDHHRATSGPRTIYRSTPVDSCRLKRPGITLAVCTGWVQKRKLSILSESVNKTEMIWGMWTNTNIYRENVAVSDIFTWNISCHSCSLFKYSMTEISQWNNW